MTRLDQPRPPPTPKESLQRDAQAAIDVLRRWVGVLPDPDTGERGIPRQRMAT
jgi:hypothetical protein